MRSKHISFFRTFLLNATFEILLSWIYLSTGERHNYNSKCDEDEFLVAADFTLYSNPMNRALYSYMPSAPKAETQTTDDKVEPGNQETAKPATGNQVVDAAAVEVADKEEEEWIASDMTKYDSPLADMERRGLDRHFDEQSRTKDADKDGASIVLTEPSSTA